MPSKPPVHRARRNGAPSHQVKPEGERPSPRQRGYDRTWEKLRAQHLTAEPLCRMCRSEGRVKAASIVDHIVKIEIRELAEHKTHVAEHYISKQGFRETMENLSATLAMINTNLTHLNERIDRVIDNQHIAPKRGGQQ